jgi:hypothetical protein
VHLGRDSPGHCRVVCLHWRTYLLWTTEQSKDRELAFEWYCAIAVQHLHCRGTSQQPATSIALPYIAQVTSAAKALLLDGLCRCRLECSRSAGGAPGCNQIKSIRVSAAASCCGKAAACAAGEDPAAWGVALSLLRLCCSCRSRTRSAESPASCRSDKQASCCCAVGSMGHNSSPVAVDSNRAAGLQVLPCL